MPGSVILAEHVRINSSTVVSDPQPQILLIVSNLNLYLLCIRVSNCVPERFSASFIQFVAH
jgi:hypothetical protein